ncbi:MAG: 3-ketoacyl-ACP reductase [Kiritimatiellia bacterium]
MNKTALVTGAGRGIGLAIARAIAAEGYNIAVCDVHEENTVEEALKSIESQGTEVLYCRCDVTERAARENMLKDIENRFKQLNVLVNNAGVAPKSRSGILEATEDSYDRVMNINLKGPYFLTQAAARWMVDQKKADADFDACIINISSISSTVASPNRGEYCISKAGVSMATKLWAAALGEFGIGVYELRPGIIQTDMTRGVKDKYDRLIEDGLLVQKRWGQPEDVGKAAASIVRGDIAYSSGQAIAVDGGLTLQRL